MHIMSNKYKTWHGVNIRPHYTIVNFEKDSQFFWWCKSKNQMARKHTYVYWILIGEEIEALDRWHGMNPSVHTPQLRKISSLISSPIRIQYTYMCFLAIWFSPLHHQNNYESFSNFYYSILRSYIDTMPSFVFIRHYIHFIELKYQQTSCSRLILAT